MPGPRRTNTVSAVNPPTSSRSSRAVRRTSPDLAQPGDWVEVDGTGGAQARSGEILDVLGRPGHLHFRVRWDEQHESLLYPAERGCIVHAGGGRRG